MLFCLLMYTCIYMYIYIYIYTYVYIHIYIDIYPPPRLRESVLGPFILAYLVPGTWYLVPGGLVQGQYTVYSIQYQLLRYLDTY